MVSARAGKREMVYIAVIVVLIAVIGFFLVQNTLVIGTQNEVTDKVKEVYQMLTDGDVEVLTTSDEGNLYKILLRLKLVSGDALREVYATKDGKFFSEAGNVFEVSGLMESLGKEKNFAGCLKSKGLLVFGQSGEPNTVQQLLVIGNFANKIYVDCIGANLQACQQLGIQQVPTIVFNQMNYTGLKTRDWIESLTGCEY